MHEDVTRIAFAGRELELRAPASQFLELPGVGSQIQTWATDDKEALTIEVRARIVATSAPNTLIPIVRYFVELGHGDSVWNEPLPFQRTAGLQAADYSLPGRGIVFQIPARQLRLGFQSAGSVGGAAVASNTVQVSMLPVYAGQEARSVPVPSSYGPTASIQAFPMNAREWRVMGANGLMITPAGPTVDLFAVSGFLFASASQTSYDEWQPIPHDAVAYRFSVAAYAAFR